MVNYDDDGRDYTEYSDYSYLNEPGAEQPLSGGNGINPITGLPFTGIAPVGGSVYDAPDPWHYPTPEKPADMAPAPSSGIDYGTDEGILKQIGIWAAMPGADPSLGADPGYWLRRIKETGGLRADNLQYWQDAGVGPTAFFNNPNRESGSSSGGSTSTSTTTSGSLPAPTPVYTPYVPNPGAQNQPDELFKFLMEKARQSTKIDPNDPMVRAQSDNYAANLERKGRRYLSELAERKGAGGNIGAESRMIAEKNAQAGAAHEGELMQHLADQRRAEIMQALSLGTQYMTAQQQRALQQELALIDQNLRAYQIQVQDNQFGRSMSQNDTQFNKTMSQREREFNDNLRQRAYEFDTDDEYRRSPYVG